MKGKKKVMLSNDKFTLMLLQIYAYVIIKDISTINIELGEKNKWKHKS